MSDEKDIEEKSVEDAEKENIEETRSEDDSEVLEFEFNEDGEEDLKKTLKKLRADLKACRKEKEEYLTGWQKERAEFSNYKKQEDERRANLANAVREHVLSKFLTVLDSFNMAFANKDAWNKVDDSWRKGVEYIYTQLGKVFEEYGLEEIGRVGEDFDPNIHQSMSMTPTDKKEEAHKISAVIQKGYKLGERVLRPANVNVFEYNEPAG